MTNHCFESTQFVFTPAVSAPRPPSGRGEAHAMTKERHMQTPHAYHQQATTERRMRERGESVLWVADPWMNGVTSL